MRSPGPGSYSYSYSYSYSVTTGCPTGGVLVVTRVGVKAKESGTGAGQAATAEVDVQQQPRAGKSYAVGAWLQRSMGASEVGVEASAAAVPERSMESEQEVPTAEVDLFPGLVTAPCALPLGLETLYLVCPRAFIGRRTGSICGDR